MPSCGEHYPALTQGCVNIKFCERAESQADFTMSERTFPSRQLITGLEAYADQAKTGLIV